MAKSKPNEVTILHLSDIHFSLADRLNAEKRFQILDSLIVTILATAKGDKSWKPKIIAISGDIVFQGDEDEFDIAEEWIEKLRGKLRLEKSDIFLCAGNHDVQRDQIRQLTKGFTEKEIKAFADENILPNKTKLEKFYKKGGPLTAFNTFCKNLEVNNFDHIRELNNQRIFGSVLHKKTNVRINVLNSAWLCRGQFLHKTGDNQGPSDQGNLFVSIELLDKLFQDVKGSHSNGHKLPSITLLHHPPDWLHWNERYRNGPKDYTAYEHIIDNSDIILSGHEHALSKRIDRLANRTQLIAAGASFHKEVADGNVIKHHFGYNSFNLLKLNRTKNVLERREFYYNLRGKPDEGWREADMEDHDKILPYGGFNEFVENITASVEKDLDKKWHKKHSKLEEQVQDVRNCLALIMRGNGRAQLPPVTPS